MLLLERPRPVSQYVALRKAEQTAADQHDSRLTAGLRMVRPSSQSRVVLIRGRLFGLAQGHVLRHGPWAFQERHSQGFDVQLPVGQGNFCNWASSAENEPAAGCRLRTAAHFSAEMAGLFTANGRSARKSGTPSSRT